LLEELGLSKYKEVFREGQINGDILAACDGETLEKVSIQVAVSITV